MRIHCIARLLGVLLLVPSAAAIDGGHALSTVSVLASDSLEGRRSGLPGGEKATAWIADQFRSCGLQPGVGDTSYFQNFTITTAVESGPMVMRKLPAAGQTDIVDFAYGRDFVSFGYGGMGVVQAPVVFVSYGIQEPDKGREDLAGADLQGKIVLALRGVPPDGGAGFWGAEGWHGYKFARTCGAGAAAYLHVGGEKAMHRTLGPDNYHPDIPAFWISGAACDRLLQGTGWTLDSLYAQANAHPAGFHFELPGQVLLESHAGARPDAPTRNVVACIPGADAELAHEIVLVGAHMDHLGVDAIGRIYHGADDNASGASLVLELARTLAADPIPARRTVYFVTFAAEDLGLLGSEEFVAHPPLPLDSIVTMIDLDMVGLGGEGVGLGGSPNFPQIWRIWESALPDSLLARLEHFQPGGGSDHAPFEALGIPAFFVDSRGDHPNYHQPEDRAEFIQPEVLAEVGEVVYRGMRAIADHPAPLANPERLTDYLWQSSETILLGAPDLPITSSDDHPDLIFYEAGKSIDPSSRNRLRRLLVELEQFDSLTARDPSDTLLRLSAFSDFPSGRRDPALALGLASPALAENQPEIFQTLARLGVLFVHVPLDREGKYFGVRGLKKPARDLLQQLQNAPQAIIWEVGYAAEAQQLLDYEGRPLIIQVSDSLEGFKEDPVTGRTEHFLLLNAGCAASLSSSEFEALGAEFGWRNLGVAAENKKAAAPLIEAWLSSDYSPSRIRDLLGLNLIRFLQKFGEPPPVVSP